MAGISKDEWAKRIILNRSNGKQPWYKRDPYIWHDEIKLDLLPTPTARGLWSEIIDMIHVQNTGCGGSITATLHRIQHWTRWKNWDQFADLFSVLVENNIFDYTNHTLEAKIAAADQNQRAAQRALVGVNRGQQQEPDPEQEAKEAYLGGQDLSLMLEDELFGADTRPTITTPEPVDNSAAFTNPRSFSDGYSTIPTALLVHPSDTVTVVSRKMQRDWEARRDKLWLQQHKASQRGSPTKKRP